MHKQELREHPPILLNHPELIRGGAPACGEGFPVSMSGRHTITVYPCPDFGIISYLKTTSPLFFMANLGNPICTSKWITSDKINGSSPIPSRDGLLLSNQSFILLHSSSFKRTVLIILLCFVDIIIDTLYTCCIRVEEHFQCTI